MKMAKAVRWTARILSVPILFIGGFFIIAHAVGPERSLPTNFPEGVAYVAMIVSLLALAVAWRWESGGSILALAAVAIGAAYNWRGLSSPAIIVPIDAVLFLVSWRLRRSQGPEHGEATSKSERESAAGAGA